MNVDKLATAIKEAERFAKVARNVKLNDYGQGNVQVKDYTKESAACKRASLDLTRALAEMRKP